MGKYLEIDGRSYPVNIVELNRQAEILDKSAYRTEDGILHRKVIGVYYNYTANIGVEDNIGLYDSLYNTLSAPVAYHYVKFPNESSAVKRYISSVTDNISRITPQGTLYKELSFNAICINPSKRG